MVLIKNKEGLIMFKTEIKTNEVCRIAEIGKKDAFFYIKEHFIGKKVRFVKYRYKFSLFTYSCYLEFMEPVVGEAATILAGQTRFFSYVKLEKCQAN
jgi:hypothetical protein